MSGGSIAEDGSEPGAGIVARDGPAGLLLFVPSQIEPERLDAALAAGRIVGALVDPDHPRGADLRVVCRARSVACLVMGDVGAVGRLGADGVHLGDARDVRAARTALGADAIIGVTIGLSRHAAMVAGEDGADYVMAAAEAGAPDAEADLAAFCTWWSELFVLPCAADARGHEASLGYLVASGADFVGVQETVWDAEVDPAVAVQEFCRALDRGQVEQRVGS